jgi:TPR repeat protein
MFYPKLRNLILILIVCLLPIKSALADLQKGKDAYERGDYETAIKEWLPLAKGGNAEAQYELSLVYSYRFAIHKAAVKWLHKSAEQDYAEAQTTLGYWYRMGRGVVQDNEEAVKWHLKAAKQGSLFSQYDLGAIYESGEGTVRDYSQARKWYRKATESRDSFNGQAFWDLAKMYDEGEKVIQDYARAHMWYNLAVAQGYTLGQVYRNILAEKMTPAQIAEAQRLAREWQKRE